MDVLEDAVDESKLAAWALASNPLKLLLRYLFAWSTEPWRGVCMSSTLLARLWPERVGASEPSTSLGKGAVVLEGAALPDGEIKGECWVGVVVEEEAVTLFDESVRRVPLLYRSGEGFTGASCSDSDRSGTEVESDMAEAGTPSTIDFRFSYVFNTLSSFDAN